MMTEEVKKSLLTAFTPNGNYLAIMSSNGTAKIWNTKSGDLLAEWKPSDGDSDIYYSCMACSFVRKKRRKEQDTCILALGDVDGNILAVDVSASEKKWTASYSSGVAGLSFANKGRVLRIVGLNGIASEFDAKTGELLKEFKTSKKPVSYLAFSDDEKYVAIVGPKLRVISWENGKEVLKSPEHSGDVQFVSISNDAKALATSEFGGKHIQVWSCDVNSGTINSGPTLPIRHPPIILECHHGFNEDNLTVLAVLGSGAAYVWNLKTSSEEVAKRTKITVTTKKVATDQQNSKVSKKNGTSIIASRLQPSAEKQTAALVTYGSINHPQFSILDISNSGEDIILNAADGTTTAQGHESVEGLPDLELEAAVPTESKKARKRQASSEPDLPTTADKMDFGHGEVADAVLLDNEPTMGEKLASLTLLDEHKAKSDKEQESSILAKPPSADSVHVLLRQALHADDRTLLLDCLYTQDEKVITKSISQLNPSNVLKLLNCLISVIESRGAILACALPWLKCLLLQHASGIMSQESSLRALNSLYQLIESRVSTFKSAIQLSSCLDILYAGVIDEEADEGQTVPVIYEDKDDSEEESEDAMETDQEEQQSDQEFDGDSDIEGSDDEMSE
ncbi:hypothetical protein L6164_004461 [Bauhinia variegata]|uniref:Uncharacterized protein n=1 Tax=Bauhinia variegata TaxID=167791 RepID=A0ACB9Q6J0_BAUVA|nr:hypothetical protein L6164_004461 [Bauhinia variegata]